MHLNRIWRQTGHFSMGLMGNFNEPRVFHFQFLFGELGYLDSSGCWLDCLSSVRCSKGNGNFIFFFIIHFLSSVPITSRRWADVDRRERREEEADIQVYITDGTCLDEHPRTDKEGLLERNLIRTYTYANITNVIKYQLDRRTANRTDDIPTDNEPNKTDKAGWLREEMIVGAYMDGLVMKPGSQSLGRLVVKNIPANPMRLTDNKLVLIPFCASLN
ncbi:hypothetical protein V8F20_000747 [Naviculisporaceae sp. PSN 640]